MPVFLSVGSLICHDHSVTDEICDIFGSDSLWG